MGTKVPTFWAWVELRDQFPRCDPQRLRCHRVVKPLEHLLDCLWDLGRACNRWARVSSGLPEALRLAVLQEFDALKARSRTALAAAQRAVQVARAEQ